MSDFANVNCFLVSPHPSPQLASDLSKFRSRNRGAHSGIILQHYPKEQGISNRLKKPINIDYSYIKNQAL